MMLASLHQHHLMFQYVERQSGSCKATLSLIISLVFTIFIYFVIRHKPLNVFWFDLRCACLQRCIPTADGDWPLALNTHQTSFSRPRSSTCWIPDLNFNFDFEPQGFDLILRPWVGYRFIPTQDVLAMQLQLQRQFLLFWKKHIGESLKPYLMSILVWK